MGGWIPLASVRELAEYGVNLEGCEGRRTASMSGCGISEMAPKYDTHNPHNMAPTSHVKPSNPLV